MSGPIIMDESDESNDFDDMESLTKGFSDMSMGPIKVLIIPFAHGGVKTATPDEKELVKGMDIKLISSVPGTCTYQNPISYIQLYTNLKTRVVFKKHVKKLDFDNQLLEYYNWLQNSLLDTLISPDTFVETPGRPLQSWKKVPYSGVSEGHIHVLKNTYEMKDFNSTTPTTKKYEPIPPGDPVFPSFEALARIIKVNPKMFAEKPFIIYMYVNKDGVFTEGITPDTYTGISLNEILYNTNEAIGKELGEEEMKKHGVHYVVADPNCSYGDPAHKFGGGSSKIYTKRNKKSRKVRAKKSRKVRAKKSRKVRAKKSIY